MFVDKPLSWLDYAVFGLSLSLSIGTGIYHAIKSRIVLAKGVKGMSAKDEYLIGGRNMPPMPVALSLLTTFLSGILMLAVPAEVFLRGPHIWLYFLMGAVASIITCFVFLPVFYRMRSTSLYEYFSHRYNSPLMRKLFSVLFLVSTILYMSVVIYAPAVALSHVMDIEKWQLVLIFGLCTTLYTCIGGLKSVVWTDSLQAVLMYGGVVALIVQGLRHPRVGGMERVWRIAKESGRLDELFRMDWRIDQYNSWWICIFSGTIYWLAAFGVNQIAMQRYSSLPSLKQAQKIILCTFLPFIILCCSIAFIGLLMLAYFYNCNPFETGEIEKHDQATILFARNILQPTPGLFGLYVSCIMSATLSTLSSGMNSMAAAIYEDFLKEKLGRKLTDTQATRVNKGLVIGCGVLATGLAFAVEPLGGILKMSMSVIGALAGPTVAIFVLAMFFPSSGVRSCLVSFLVSVLCMTVICVANHVQKPYGEKMYLPTNTSTFGCGSSTFNISDQSLSEIHYGKPDTHFISRISTYSYPGIGFVIMIILGVSISTFFKEQKPERIQHLTFYGRNDPWPERKHERTHYLP